jgi:hypothetical protein|tara:strand:+ start:5356 stop:5619 length:264 start_codon:yes stop_codon:yes gene_type:complete
LKRLIESGKKAFDLLLEEVEKPIDPELQDDKARNAMKAKKECFMDAQEILTTIHKIESQNSGEKVKDALSEEEKAFQAGFSEKYAKK